MYSINSEVSSKSNVKANLEGNRIVTVTFDGVESKEIVSKKDGTKYDILNIKFSNEEGIFEDGVFEPKPGDEKRKVSDQGYTNPSVVEELMAKFRHLIAAVNPELDAQIESKAKSLTAPNWKALCILMGKATAKGIGKTVQIKLMNDKDGKGQFPRYYLGISRNDKLYMRTNFIAPNGSVLAFTDKEKERMATVAAAKPTSMAKNTGIDDMDEDVNTSAEGGDGLDFDLEDL